jgi:hypothetical protein
MNEKKIVFERKVPVVITLSGTTFDDYKDCSDEEIIEAFRTFYNVKRKDFNILTVYSERVKKGVFVE